MRLKTLKKVSFKGLSGTIRNTFLATTLLLIVLFGLSIVVYGLNVTSLQFLTYWYFMIILALSFGFQISREVQPL